MNKDKIKKVLDAAFSTENASFRMRAAIALASLSKIGFNEDYSSFNEKSFTYLGTYIKDDDVYFLKLDMFYGDDHINEQFDLDIGKVMLCVCYCPKGKSIARYTNKYFKDKSKGEEFVRMANILSKSTKFSLATRNVYGDCSHMIRLD